MTPILFPANTKAGGFNTHGLGNIADAASCIVKEQLNGEYTATLTLPVDSIRYKDLQGECLVLIKPNPEDDPQPFRVSKFSRPMRGLVTASLRHWSYDLSGYPVGPFTASTAAEAVSNLATKMLLPCPFSFATDLAASGRTMTVRAPTSARALMGDQNNQILRTFGGEWRFNKTAVELLTRRGADRGFSVRYRKNLVDLKQEEQFSEVYSAIMPYWVDTTGTLVQGTTVNHPGTPVVTRVLALDLSDWFRDPPTVSELDQAAARWIQLSNPWTPKANMKVELAVIGKDMEPDRPESLDDIRLGDTVRVWYERLGVEATARVIETNFNALTERFESVVIGTPVNSAADSVVDAKQEARAAADQARAARDAAKAASSAAGKASSAAAAAQSSANTAQSSANTAQSSANTAQAAASAARSAASAAQSTANAAKETADQAKFDIDTFLNNLNHGTVAANYIAANMIELRGNGAAIVFTVGGVGQNYRPKTATVKGADGSDVTLEYLGI